MATLSCFAAWVPLLVAFVALTFVRGGFRARAMLVVLGLVIAISDVAISDTIKRAVNRPRPREAMAGVRVVDLQPGLLRTLAIFKKPAVEMSRPEPSIAHGHSFPSGHTTNDFSAATVLAFFYRRRGWLCFIPAALVGYSRIYVGAHWPGDVLTSIFLGVGTSLLLLALFEWLWRKHGARLAPAIHARHPSLSGGQPA